MQFTGVDVQSAGEHEYEDLVSTLRYSSKRFLLTGIVADTVQSKRDL